MFVKINQLPGNYCALEFFCGGNSQPKPIIKIFYFVQKLIFKNVFFCGFGQNTKRLHFAIFFYAATHISFSPLGLYYQLSAFVFVQEIPWQL